MSIYKTLLCATLLALLSHPADARTNDREGLLKQLIEKRQEQHQAQKSSGAEESRTGLYAKGENYQGKKTNDTFNGRDMVVYVPSRLPPAGQRALIVVLHGGGGNALQIQNYLGLDPLADTYGFVVAYLNGTKVMRVGTDNMRGWNAGECCGQPASQKTDDVGYITGAIDYITTKYGIDKARIYGMGHSNGGMMTQRLMCETNLYAAAIPISAPLELNVASCPPAKGKNILALHGADDKNVPINGGYGPDAVNKNLNYRAAADSQKIFQNSGADYQLWILDGADHSPKTINAALIKSKGMTLPQTIVQFFGLGKLAK